MIRAAFALVLAGCAAAPPTAERPAEDWSRLLPGLLPAMEICMRYAPKEPPVGVALARPAGRDQVAVRVVDGRGRRFDCLATPDGRFVDDYAAVDPDEPPLPGEDAPRFLPASAPEREAPGARTERVEIGGRFVGRLSYPAP